jgi:hypothetical protein
MTPLDEHETKVQWIVEWVRLVDEGFSRLRAQLDVNLGGTMSESEDRWGQRPPEPPGRAQSGTWSLLLPSSGGQRWYPSVSEFKPAESRRRQHDGDRPGRPWSVRPGDLLSFPLTPHAPVSGEPLVYPSTRAPKPGGSTPGGVGRVGDRGIEPTDALPRSGDAQSQ